MSWTIDAEMGLLEAAVPADTHDGEMEIYLEPSEGVPPRVKNSPRLEYTDQELSYAPRVGPVGPTVPDYGVRTLPPEVTSRSSTNVKRRPRD